MKNCSKCGELKPLLEFNRRKSAKDGRRSECKKCQRSIDRAYYEDNADKVAARTSEYYRANKEKYRELGRNWALNNPDKSKARYLRYRNANIEECRARDEAYRRSNLHKDAKKTAKRRAAKLQRTPPWLSPDHLAYIELFYANAAHLTETTGIPHHVDHIIPLQGETVSGLHVPWNMQVLTASENSSKGNKI